MTLAVYCVSLSLRTYLGMTKHKTQMGDVFRFTIAPFADEGNASGNLLSLSATIRSILLPFLEICNTSCRFISSTSQGSTS